jgi:hypothetical protein
MPATKEPVTLDQLHQPKPAAVDLDTHLADMRRRQAEIDAKREEMIKCTNPAYARQKELEKPQFVWTIECEWYAHAGGKKGIVQFHRKASVVAQNENDAWSAFCDKIQCWPSRRDVKLKIRKGKQMTASQIAAEAASPDDGMIPRVEFHSKNDPNWIEA